MPLKDTVARHYAQSALEETIFAALKAAGKDVDRLVPEDLAPVDEFHIGGRQATVDFAAACGFAAGSHLIDIGCGLGGPSRFFAGQRGCRVTGIDLTPEYIAVAEMLARRVGLADEVSYRQGSALTLPFPAAAFDGAYMLHVGMNIEAKAALFAGLRRVLKPGAVFGIYDVMREGEGALNYPMPWASDPAASFVESAATYGRLLTETGFAVEAARSRRDFAIESFRQARARIAAAGGPPPVGLHLVMGASARQKVANMSDGVERGVISPTEIIARAI
jgi:SAM-dependent methyltransferase